MIVLWGEFLDFWSGLREGCYRVASVSVSLSEFCECVVMVQWRRRVKRKDEHELRG